MTTAQVKAHVNYTPDQEIVLSKSTVSMSYKDISTRLVADGPRRSSSLQHTVLWRSGNEHMSM